MATLKDSEQNLEDLFKDNPKVQLAFDLVKKYHTGKRKHGTPEHSHPYQVAALASKGFDDDTCIVALLHDLIEDHKSKYSEADLRKDFPDYIADDVMALTKDDGDTNVQYYRGIKEAGTRAQNIKAYDRFHNLSECACFELDRRKSYVTETEVYVLKLPDLDIDTRYTLEAMVDQIKVLNSSEELLLESLGTPEEVEVEVEVVEEPLEVISSSEEPRIYELSRLSSMTRVDLESILRDWGITQSQVGVSTKDIVNTIIQCQSNYKKLSDEASKSTEQKEPVMYDYSTLQGMGLISLRPILDAWGVDSSDTFNYQVIISRIIQCQDNYNKLKKEEESSKIPEKESKEIPEIYEYVELTSMTTSELIEILDAWGVEAGEFKDTRKLISKVIDCQCAYASTKKNLVFEQEDSESLDIPNHLQDGDEVFFQGHGACFYSETWSCFFDAFGQEVELTQEDLIGI